MKSGIVGPHREGAQLSRVFALLIRIELAEIYMSAGESKSTLPMRNNSMLRL